MSFIKKASILLVIAVLASCSPMAVHNTGDGKIWPELGYTPKLPIGMNLPELNFWDQGIAFTDAMTSASEMLTAVGNDLTDPNLIDKVDRDPDGYPIGLPQGIDGKTVVVRFYLNNRYSGRYRIDYQGTGTLGGSAQEVDGKYYIDFDGTGDGRWIDILTSDAKDYIKDMHVYPEAIADNATKPMFLPQFLAGLQPFHAIRFMDWPKTNGSTDRPDLGSTQVEWADRITPTYYTQGSDRGVCWEYAIELCKELGADAWVCVPHKASDDYIQKMATLFKGELIQKTDQKVYLEFSNEMWNFNFAQYDWIDNNAPGAANSYVSTALAGIGAYDAGKFPEKDAYMMARAFRIWGTVFSGADRSRLVNVVTGQAAWVDNTRRILEYLDGADASMDALAVGGYFSFNEDDHNKWKANSSSVTPGIICDAVFDELEENSNAWARASAALAKQYTLQYLVYEGGQHMAPIDWQTEWPYYEKLYDAQIDSKMYQLYLWNFDTHVKSDVDCKLFMAYNYVGERKSINGSWGHLESLDDVGKSYSTIAPKFQALLDCNTPK